MKIYRSLTNRFLDEIVTLICRLFKHDVIYNKLNKGMKTGQCKRCGIYIGALINSATIHDKEQLKKAWEALGVEMPKEYQ